MLTMISSPPTPAHVIGPFDLTASATFDLSGNVLAGNLDVPRYVFEVEMSSELRIHMSHGQMELLKMMGGALGRAETRKKYRACGRPTVGLLPSIYGPGGTMQQRVGGRRPPTKSRTQPSDPI